MKFGQAYANALRRRPRPGDKGHLDEVFVTRRHLMTAGEHRLETITRFTIWDQITGSTGLAAAAM